MYYYSCLWRYLGVKRNARLGPRVYSFDNLAKDGEDDKLLTYSRLDRESAELRAVLCRVGECVPCSLALTTVSVV